VAHSAQRIVFVSRAGVDIDTDTGEVTGQSFGRDAYAIGESRDLVKLDWVLRLLAMAAGCAYICDKPSPQPPHSPGPYDLYMSWDF
jgi:hypothetical protein